MRLYSLQASAKARSSQNKLVRSHQRHPRHALIAHRQRVAIVYAHGPATAPSDAHAESPLRRRLRTREADECTRAHPQLTSVFDSVARAGLTSVGGEGVSALRGGKAAQQTHRPRL